MCMEGWMDSRYTGTHRERNRRAAQNGINQTFTKFRSPTKGKVR